MDNKNYLKKNWRKFLFLFISVILLSEIIVFSQTFDYTVRGRVIDDMGNPLSKANVRLIGLVVYGVYENYLTDKDGRFSIIDENKKGNSLYLYVSGGSHVGRTLIDPPFEGVNKINQYFVGQQIKFGKEKVIDVGDIKVQFWFADVNIRFRIDGKNLSRQQWESLWMVLKDDQNRTVWEETVGPEITEKTKVDLEKSEIKLSLPEGKWKIEFQKYDWETGKISPEIIGETPYFVIDKKSETETVDVLINKIKE